MKTMEKLRQRFVSEQIEARGVRDPLVLAAMRSSAARVLRSQETSRTKPMKIGRFR